MQKYFFMIKNRMPLTKLLTIVLLTFVGFTACFGFAISLEMRGNDDAQIFVMIFAAISFLLLNTLIGIWMRKNWARIFLIFILVVAILAWTGLMWYWFQAIWPELSRDHKLILPFFSLFLYPILLGGIFLLINAKFKEEFEKKSSQ